MHFSTTWTCILRLTHKYLLSNWQTSSMTCFLNFFFLMSRRPTTSTHRYTLFPYTTLFRSPDGKALNASTVPLATSLTGTAVFGSTRRPRSEEHTSELQSHSGISYAVFC